MEVALSNIYQIVTSACFTGTRKHWKATEEKSREGKKKTYSLLAEIGECVCVLSVRKLMEVRMTYTRLIMYSTCKFSKEFPIKLIFITTLTKCSTTTWYITFEN